MNNPVGVFVYGSLKRGYPNYHLVSNATHIEPATTKGTLYDLSFNYPAMTAEGTDNVKGEFMQFENMQETLKTLDMLEAYNSSSPNNSIYLRVPLKVHLETGNNVNAWGYIFDEAKVKSLNAKKIPEGKWDVPTSNSASTREQNGDIWWGKQLKFQNTSK